MDKRVEVRCSEGEKLAWEAAAGRVPLSRWLRDVANGAAEPVGFIPDSDGMVVGVAGSVPYPPESWSRSVRPDFKGGKQ